MKSIRKLLFAAVLCLSLLAGCSSQKAIVGKWRGENDTQFEFAKDGKLTVTIAGRTVVGSYTLPDDGHYKMALVLSGTKQEQTVAYTVNGDTLTTDNGTKYTMTRVK